MSSWKKAGFSGSRWRARLFRRLARGLIGPSEAIDVEMMPDAWKRDVGLLDGREPRTCPKSGSWNF